MLVVIIALFSQARLKESRLSTLYWARCGWIY